MTEQQNEKAPAPTKVQGAFQNTDQDYSATWSASSKGVFTQCDVAEIKGTKNTWPELQPLVVSHDPVEYPLDALPNLIRDAVMEVGAYVKAPIPLLATSALSAISLAIQAHVDVERAPQLVGPSSCYFLAIAESGERKTTCDRFFHLAIQEFEESVDRDAKPGLVEFKAKHAVWEAHCNGLKDAIKTQFKRGESADIQDQELAEIVKNEPISPRVARMTYGDATPEKLALELSTKWPSGAVISSEAGTVFGSHGMSPDSAMRNMGLLNQLWDGVPTRIDRKTSESINTRGARFSMGLQVQETTVRQFFDNSKGLARGTGFLARFLMSWPESTQGFRLFSDPPESWLGYNKFNNRITEILKQDIPRDSDGILNPVVLKLNSEAKEYWVRFHDSIEIQLRSGKKYYDVRDLASKTADNAARLAALFHYFSADTGQIDICAMRSGALIAEWHLNEGQRFLGELALASEFAHPMRLESWLVAYCKETRSNKVPTRDVQRLGPKQLRENSKLMPAVKTLSEFGRARMRVEGRKKWLELNPILMSF